MSTIDVTATRIATQFKHTSPLIGCRFEPSGRYLFASAQDNTIQRFDLFTGRRTSFTGHASWCRGIAFVSAAVTPMPAAARQAIPIPIDQPAILNVASSLASKATAPNIPFTLLSADYLGEIRWWDGTSDKPSPARTIVAHEGWVRALAVSPDRKLLASCGNDRLVKLWNISDGKPVRTFEGHESHVYNVAFNPSGTTIVSADLKGIVKEWGIASGKQLRELDAKAFHKYDTNFAADIGGIRGMEFSADGQKLACIGITNVSNAFAGVGNPMALLFDMKDGKAKQLKPKETNYQGTGWGVGFLPNGLIVGAGGAGQGRIWFWKPEDASNIHTVNVPTNARDMDVHPDGTALAIAGANGTAYVYTLSPAPPGTKKEAPPPPKKK
jgi:WD40 repeat protein